jgi:hypothetical protein
MIGTRREHGSTAGWLETRNRLGELALQLVDNTQDRPEAGAQELVYCPDHVVVNPVILIAWEDHT